MRASEAGKRLALRRNALRTREDSLDSARETQVALGVVVLETDLEPDGLDKVASLLVVGGGEELLDRAPHA